ncbi:MAG TPA: MmcQ/YjbR family DNA-binding protein [Bryobacteraceae bacterium]|nr:MmcQ/YjbR family DNA-binding protein [Bryobacteraceae bacterium]
MENALIERVRRICATMPESSEKLSHGEPTFFVRKKVFVMFSNNHHNDGHVAVWIPVPPGMQALLIQDAPETYYRPPYVGVKGWVGVELSRIGDAELTALIQDAWRLIAPKTLKHPK